MSDRIIDCETADQFYATARVMGTGEYSQKLYDHAVYCPQEQWHHALRTNLWSFAANDRHRAANPPRHGNRLL